MSTLIVANPISGRGRAARCADAIDDALRADGRPTRRLDTEPASATTWLRPALTDVTELVVVGGDGTVRSVAPCAAATGVPLYHAPQGTENLFAREFGMSSDPASVCAAVRAGRVRRIDMGRANGSPFLLMTSIGFDAEVVHDLASVRSGAITHLAYVPRILSQLRRWVPPRVGVRVDDVELVTPGTSACVIVANSRQYGGRLDPAPAAAVDDGRLDVVVLPVRSARSIPGLMLRLRRRRHDRSVRVAQGRHVEVVSAAPVRFQIDGDRPLDEGLSPLPPVTTLTVTIDPASLSVLMPA
jgi:diacylglycerol kinase family enzyme